MSVRDLNKIIFLYSALNGELIFKIDFKDYIDNESAKNYFLFKLTDLISNEEGAIIKIGFKN